MPAMNGLAALKQIMSDRPTPVVMISTLTNKGAETTMEALNLGAVDFICKPNDGSFREFRTVADEIVAKVRSASHAKVCVSHSKVSQSGCPIRTSDRVIVIASSTGGPRALATLWQQWPKKLQVPILIVQHMPASFTASLANRLDGMGTIPCHEAKPGDAVRPGVALMAPGGLHMRIQSDGALSFDEGPTIHGVRPAADHLFTSAASVFGSRTVGIVLTGMGRDGAAGARAISEAGGLVFGESEQTAVVYGMPKAAKELGALEAEAPIHEIGHVVMANLGRRIAHAS
jgi:two-component system chemotaxis response regulator CheB